MDATNPGSGADTAADIHAAVRRSLDLATEFSNRARSAAGAPHAGRGVESLPPLGGHLAALRSASAEVDIYSSQIAELPPEPPTARGRLGGSIIRALRRVLWWQTSRLQEVFRAFSRRQRIEMETLEGVEASLQRVNERCRGLEDAQLRLQSRLTGLVTGQEFHRLQSSLGKITSDLEALRASVEASPGRVPPGSPDAAAPAAVDPNISSMVREIGKQLDTLRGEVSMQQLRISLLTKADRSREPFGAPSYRFNGTAKETGFDELYVAFEDIFRGSRADVKERLAVYLHDMKSAGIGAPGMPIVDLGCGRGEWLELLRSNQMDAHGVDRNPVMLETCRGFGLDVRRQDALSYLSTVEDESLGGVTAFHLIEHLPFDYLIALVDQSLRALRPGGWVIFETPNPANIAVGAHTFYLDPTHLHPLPSSMMRFFVEARGFTDVEIKELNPDPEWRKLEGDDDPVVARINQYFHGPRDYAVIGRKPGSVSAS